MTLKWRHVGLKAHKKLLFVFIVYIKGGKTGTSIPKKTTTKQKINNFCLYPWRKIYDERHELYWYQGFLIYISNNQNNLLGRNKVRLKEWRMESFSRISRVSQSWLLYEARFFIRLRVSGEVPIRSLSVCIKAVFSYFDIECQWTNLQISGRKSTKFSEIHKKLQNLPRRRFIFAPEKKLFLLHDIITYTWCVTIEFPNFFMYLKIEKLWICTRGILWLTLRVREDKFKYIFVKGEIL